MITGVESFGLFVQGMELPAEGFVPIVTLADDFYQFDRRSHTLSGRREGNIFRLGDLMRVAVARVDIDAASWISGRWATRPARPRNGSIWAFRGVLRRKPRPSPS